MSDQIDENITTFGLCKSRFSFLKGSLLESMSVETETEFESNFCVRGAPWAKKIRVVDGFRLMLRSFRLIDRIMCREYYIIRSTYELVSVFNVRVLVRLRSGPSAGHLWVRAYLYK
jgi:hypothetical protein